LYEELFARWREEKLSEGLQPLPEDFYGRLSSYIADLMDGLRLLDEKSFKAQLMSEELARARKLASDLIELRFEKLWKGVLKGGPAPPGSIAREEGRLRVMLLEVAMYLGDLKGSIEDGTAPPSPWPMGSKILAVRFLQDIPAIVGIDMKEYGPFKREEVAALPLENAEALIRKGAAERIQSAP
jgi:DNA replication factor GINS